LEERLPDNISKSSILLGVIIEAALAGVFFALIMGWLAGVLAVGLLSFYWLIQFRQLKIEPF
jgi:hypothetical protein